MLLAALFVTAAHAETAWISWSELTLVRWPEAAQLKATWTAVDGAAPAAWPGTATPSGKVGKGDEVEVLVRDGSLARVRKGTDIGWVPAGALSATEVARPLELPFDLSGGLPPGLSFPPPAAPE
jgi:hypothetical protein